MIRTTSFIGLCIAAWAAASPASAAVIVDTGLSPFNGAFGFNLDGFAGKFTTSATVITGIEAGVSSQLYGFSEDPLDFSFHIALYEGSGEVPGAELYSAQVRFDGSPAWHGLSGLDWSVPAGDYFVAAETRPNDSCFCIMSDFVPFPLANNAIFGPGDSYVEADWLAVGFRVNADAGAIPEPASWAMLIAGFGLTGAALRRRRSHGTGESISYGPERRS